MCHASKLRWGLAGLLFLPSSLRADWIELSDGTALRGIDYRVRGDRSTFTLEDGRTVSVDPALVLTVTKSPPGEKVEFRGKSVPLAEKVRAMKVEEEKRRKEALRSLEKWARGKEEAQESKDAFAGLPEEARGRYLAAALKESEAKEARYLAARELAQHKGLLAVRALSRAAVVDRQAPVRAASLVSLKALNDPATPEAFLPYLASPRQNERLQAVSALEQFPSRKAVPALIDTMRMTWTGFGRGFFSQVTERAYISDYELVSGGTGFQIIEVADPVVSKMSEGVVLDVHVQKVELVAHANALRKITGQDFGTDVKRWQEWWAANGGQ
jgi:hypothetical protein